MTLVIFFASDVHLKIPVLKHESKILLIYVFILRNNVVCMNKVIVKKVSET